MINTGKYYTVCLLKLSRKDKEYTVTFFNYSTLLSHLQLLSQFTNPKSLYKEGELRNIYMEVRLYKEGELRTIYMGVRLCKERDHRRVGVGVMVFNATFNNISVI